MTAAIENTSHSGKQSCPVCNSARTKYLFDNWDFGHGYPGKYPLWSCRDCRHIWVAAAFTPEMLTDMYSNYYRRRFDVDRWQPYKETSGFSAWLNGDDGQCHRHVPPNVRVLDIGCGYCQALGYHQARGCEVWGCEADAGVQKIADKFGFHFHNGLFNPDHYEKNYFDYVTMDQVLEHSIDPLGMLSQIRSVLKPGGKVVIAVPNPYCIERYTFGRLWLGWHIPFHQHLFSKRSAQTALEKSGFRLEKAVCCYPAAILFVNWGFLFVHGNLGKPTLDQFCGTSILDREHFGDAESYWYVRLYRFVEKLRIHSLLAKSSCLLGFGMSWIYTAVKE